ncbi:hypothetical protein O181_127867 [Austropuccinia psidii MF-1]|uniref:Uncharacterized protein n=1 Tax=Austropuccinia psidii MF-1 TaxID=1389203 RepID=A0A9Q3KYR3_9BASI|nr:hypothetical protein [Austropuccinia psidii MF-1]
MPSTRSGAGYKPSRSSQKGHRHDYGRSQSDTEGQGSGKDIHDNKLSNSEADDTILPSKRAETAISCLSGHLESQQEGLQQCTTAQRVPDPCRSVEKLHELIPDCKKIPGNPNTCKLLNGWHPLMKKKNMILLTAEWRENNPSPPKQAPRPATVARSRNSNVKKQPQAQNNGKGKEPVPKPYRQCYRMPWKMYFIWPEP